MRCWRGPTPEFYLESEEDEEVEGVDFVSELEADVLSPEEALVCFESLFVSFESLFPGDPFDLEDLSLA